MTTRKSQPENRRAATAWALADALQDLDPGIIERFNLQPPDDWPIFNELDGPGSPAHADVQLLHDAAPPPAWDPEPAPETGPEALPEAVPQPVPQAVREAPDSESGDWSQAIEKCSATTRSGQPCRAFPRAGRELCIFHDPDYAEQNRENASRGGKTPRATAPANHYIPVSLHDRTAVQALLDAIVRLELFGQIPLKRSAHILRAVSLASRNFDKPVFVPSQGHRQVHPHDEYWDHRETIDSYLDDIVQALHTDHHNTRAETITDASARVYEIEKVKQLFTKDPAG